MASLTETPGLDPVVQIETTDVVLGGAGQIANQQAQALLNQIAWLRKELSAATLYYYGKF